MYLVNCIFVALLKDLNATLLSSKLAYSYLEGALYARLRPLQVTFKHDALFSEDPDKKVIILSVKLNSSEISYWFNQFKHCSRGPIYVLEFC